MLTEQILLQLIVILLTVQLCGFLCKLLGQQWVIGEILAGLALGPSLLGLLLPGVKAFIFPVATLPTLQTLGDIGLVLYMFSLGARLDIHHLLRQSHKAAITSISGMVLPMLLGAIIAFLLFPALAGPKATLPSFVLLVATAMAITAFPVLARLLTERHMLGTPIGTLALTCAAAGDVVAWCLLALVIATVHAGGLPSVALTVGLTTLFIVVMLIIIRPLLAYADRRITSRQLLLAISVILLFLASYTTNALGIHPIFGAFLMGIILPRKLFYVSFVRDIDRVNIVLFLPLYFVYSGLHTQIGLLNTPWLWLICMSLLLLACIGKIVGSMLPIRLMGESWRDSLGLGILMNTRGLVELIVLNIGLSLGVLSPTLFAMLVIVALVTTMMASPLLPLLGYKQSTISSDDLQERDTTTLEQASQEG